MAVVAVRATPGMPMVTSGAENVTYSYNGRRCAVLAVVAYCGQGRVAENPRKC